MVLDYLFVGLRHFYYSDFFTVLFPSIFKKSTSLGTEKLSSINKIAYPIPIINPIDSLLSDFNYEVIIQDSNKNSFNGFSDNYQEDSSQILCFRGDEGRRNPTRGFIKSEPSKIFVDWKFETKTSKEWGGVLDGQGNHYLFVGLKK